MAIDDALNRGPRKNSFGDAAAAMSNPGVTQVQTAAPAAPQSAAARMAALPGAAPATPTAPSASVGTSAREQMSTLPGNQPTVPKPISPTNIFPQGNPSAGRSPYASPPAAAQSAREQMTTLPGAAPASLESRVSQIPTGGLRAPAPDGSQNDLLNTDIGRNARNAMMALPGVGGLARVASTGGAISSGINAASSGLNAASRMMALGAGVAAAGPAPAAANTTVPGATTAQSAREQMNSLPAGAGAGRGVINPDSVNPAAPPPQSQAAMAMQSIGDVKREGNSYSGTNVSGDITINGQAPRNGGQVSTENMAAADALGAHSAAQAMMRLPSEPGAVPRGVQAPAVAHSGNSWSAQNALRNAQVSASSIMNNGGSWDKHKGVSPERAYAAAMENADFAARGAQPGMNQAAMRENAATQREGMQQAGSTARAQMQEVGQNNRFGQTQGLARDKFGLEQETQGIQNRDASLISAMRAQIAQEKDPAKRQSVVQRMREMQGTQQADPYLVVPGGQQIDPTSQRAYNTPASVFNRQTGQWVQQPGSGGTTNKFQAGQIYVDGQGRRAKFNGTGWEPA